MKLRFTPRAMNDLTAIRRFIRDEYGNPKAAKRITDSIFAQCTNLKQFPQSGTALSARFEIDTDVRYLVCEGYMQNRFQGINRKDFRQKACQKAVIDGSRPFLVCRRGF